MLILLVEDNPDIQKVNQELLEMSGYRVKIAMDLAEAKAIISTQTLDLIVLDVMLPDGNGLDFLYQMRQNGIDTPVLVLTALSEVDDEVKGLKAGGDDYLTKPYDFEVLAAHIEALLRRTKKKVARIKMDDLELDVMARQALYKGEDMGLAQKEFALLQLFMENPGQPMSPEYLYETIWARPMMLDDSALKSAMSRLRKKLQQSGYLITALRGEGYQFERDNSLE
jgi:DNA-binding response OmpR family regulator